MALALAFSRSEISNYITLGSILLSFVFNSLKKQYTCFYVVGRGRGMDSVTSEGERIYTLIFSFVYVPHFMLALLLFILFN